MNEEQNLEPKEEMEQAPAASELTAKCDEYLAGWKRAQADYLNLKKESEREKSELVKFANQRLLSDLLPAIDQFELALRFAPDTAELPEDAKKKFETWLAGIKAVKTSWERTFKDLGLEQVATDGAFNPAEHEAVSEEPSDLEAGNITRVVQPGWKLNGKLLSPARVIVSKGHLSES